MFRRIAIGAVLGFAICGSSAAQTTPQSSPAHNPPTQPVPVMTDAQFLDKALDANRFEVETGKLAQAKASDPKLKAFAAQMVTDHGKALSELQDVAKSLNRPVPDKLNSLHQAKYDALQAKDGSGFDMSYKGEMKSGHAETLMMLQTHSSKVMDPKLKAWIDKTIPVVQHHKSMIDGM